VQNSCIFEQCSCVSIALMFMPPGIADQFVQHSRSAMHGSFL
jgi:hypothetical protein